jgi:uncharacterized protein (UPF0332 family)
MDNFIQYRIERAWETLDEAEILANSGHWNACVNRLYYACFYAVSALLNKYGLSSSKHSGLRSLFNHNFVRNGIIPRETAIIYNSLFERRQEGDYDAFVTFKEDDVNPWLNEAAIFVETIVKVIEKKC